jgi:hypothetical protein
MFDPAKKAFIWAREEKIGKMFQLVRSLLETSL